MAHNKPVPDVSGELSTRTTQLRQAAASLQRKLGELNSIEVCLPLKRPRTLFTASDCCFVLALDSAQQSLADRLVDLKQEIEAEKHNWLYAGIASDAVTDPVSLKLFVWSKTRLFSEPSPFIALKRYSQALASCSASAFAL
jgi:hypothetical protein